MSSSEKIPKAMVEKYSAISALTDAFCTRHLNEEYRNLVHRVLGALARKRLSPLSKGKENGWAAAAVLAAGHVNFLNDATQTPHCSSKSIVEFFGIAESTGHNKSREIRDLLKMSPFSPEWTLQSKLAANPMVWMLEVDGLVIDIRDAPLELQELAFAKGLIPFIPTE
jgi:hypothetical protein